MYWPKIQMVELAFLEPVHFVINFALLPLYQPRWFYTLRVTSLRAYYTQEIPGNRQAK